MMNLLSTHDAAQSDACSAKLLPRRLTSVSPSWPVLLFSPQQHARCSRKTVVHHDHVDLTSALHGCESGVVEVGDTNPDA